MNIKTEKDLFKAIKKELVPYYGNAFRIETPLANGVPDALISVSGNHWPVELKIGKHYNREDRYSISIKASQIVYYKKLAKTNCSIDILIWCGSPKYELKKVSSDEVLRVIDNLVVKPISKVYTLNTVFFTNRINYTSVEKYIKSISV